MSGQLWVTNSLGGYMSSQKLSKYLRYALQPTVKFRQFCDAKGAFGKHKGELYTYNVYNDVATQGNTLVETDTMPETNFTITQGTISVTEAGNAVPYTGKLDDLSEHPVKSIINKALKNDAKKFFDCVSHAEFNKTPLRVQASDGTDTAVVTLLTASTHTDTNNVAMRKGHVSAVVDTMKERNIPPYRNEDYVCIGWPSTFRTLKNDLESVYQYVTEGYKQIYNGEIGKYEKCRFVEQTQIPKGGANDSTTWNAYSNTSDAWDNAKSDWAFFLGQDGVTEAIAVPEEMRGKLPSDYGRSKGVAWYYLGGFGIIHTTAAQARIVKWDSAS